MVEPRVKLLVLDDEASIQELLGEALADGGFSVDFESAGHAAIDRLEAGARYRGLVTDIELGSGPDGWEVARRARELDPGIAVVYTSGAKADEWAANGVPNSTFVTKPFALAQVVTAISALLNKTDDR